MQISAGLGWLLASALGAPIVVGLFSYVRWLDRPGELPEPEPSNQKGY